MAVELSAVFKDLTDEKFSEQSKTSLVTNSDFVFDGANTVKIYKVTTVLMNDYDRNGTGSGKSRYGEVKGLDATTEEFTLKKDRSFTFAIDRLDEDETQRQLEAGKALERQLREVVIPEIDSYTYGVMAQNAGTKATSATLTAENIYEKIIEGSKALDDAEVLETNRCLIVTPETYMLMKKSTDIAMDTDISNEMRIKGVLAMLDGMNIVKVPSSRLPEAFGFMIAHPSATVAPTKLSDYRIHSNPPGISGDLIEGRFAYDAFVLDNKAKGIYYQPKE